MKWLNLFFIIFTTASIAEVEHLARYEYQGKVAYGQIINKQIQPLKGELFGVLTPTGQPLPLNKVELLIPTEPQKVFAVGMNFASHISSASSAPPPLFLKLPSSLVASGKEIQLPADANNVHFEGELVLIIGKQAKDISENEAHEVIFAVTVGNDLTERTWQGRDLQWMRAKASDGFGPIGSTIAIGVDYNNLEHHIV